MRAGKQNRRADCNPRASGIVRDDATRADIAAQLFDKPPLSFLHSFDRPNLDLRFAPKDKPREQMAMDHFGKTVVTDVAGGVSAEMKLNLK